MLTVITVNISVVSGHTLKQKLQSLPAAILGLNVLSELLEEP
jgi:hypothetical protein